MNKKMFYQELRQNLKNFNSDEVEKIIEYYDELINEKMDNGFSEEEAIRSFGDMKKIIHSVTADLVMVRSEEKKTNSLRNSLIILGICFSPMLLPIGISFFAIIFSIFMVFISLMIAFSASSIGILIGIIPTAIGMASYGAESSVIVLTVGLSIMASGILMILALGVLQVGKIIFNFINRQFSKLIKRKAKGGQNESY